MLWKGFQRPKRLEFERETLTDRFGRFYAQPFERGTLARHVDADPGPSGRGGDGLRRCQPDGSASARVSPRARPGRRGKSGMVGAGSPRA